MRAAIDRFKFWTRSDFAETPDVEYGGGWMIEGRLGYAYHPVFLLNADEREARELAFVFWKLAGIKTQLNDN